MVCDDNLFISRTYGETPEIRLHTRTKSKQKTGPTLDLHVRFRDKNALMSEMATLKSLDWTYFMRLGNPDPLRILDPVLPLDYEARVMTDGGFVYVNRKIGVEFLVPSITTSYEQKRPYHILLSGFEARVTEEGRIYYLNNATKSTSWEQPEDPPANTTKDTADGIEEAS